MKYTTLGKTNLALAPEEIEALDALTAPKPLYPYTWRASGGDPIVRQALRG